MATQEQTSCKVRVYMWFVEAQLTHDASVEGCDMFTGTVLATDVRVVCVKVETHFPDAVVVITRAQRGAEVHIP